MSQPHLLMIVPSLRRGGAEAQVATLAAGLAGKGFRVTLMTFEQGDGMASILAGSAVELVSEKRSGRLDRALARRIAQFIDEHDVTVVHATLQIAAFYAGWARQMASRTTALFVAVHTTHQRSWYDNVMERLVFQRAYHWADRLIFVCHAQAKRWCDRYPALGGKSVVVYNGIDAEHFERDRVDADGRELRSGVGIGQEEKVLCCVAAFRPEKQQAFLIEAFRAAQSADRLLLVGDGPLRGECEGQVKSLALQDRVLFIGEVADVRPYIVASDATVLASSTETFSIAMLESRALGVPMIAPRVGGLPEAILPGVSGELFETGDSASLVAAIDRTLGDEPRRQAMSKKAAAMVRDKFTVDKMVDETAALLFDSISGPAGRSLGSN